MGLNLLLPHECKLQETTTNSRHGPIRRQVGLEMSHRHRAAEGVGSTGTAGAAGAACGVIIAQKPACGSSEVAWLAQAKA